MFEKFWLETVRLNPWANPGTPGKKIIIPLAEMERLCRMAYTAGHKAGQKESEDQRSIFEQVFGKNP